MKDIYVQRFLMADIFLHILISLFPGYPKPIKATPWFLYLRYVRYVLSSARFLLLLVHNNKDPLLMLLRLCSLFILLIY